MTCQICNKENKYRYYYLIKHDGEWIKVCSLEKDCAPSG